MALNYSETQEMIAACEKNDVQLHVAYYRRGMSRFLKIKELLDQGEIGEVRTVNIRLARPIAKEEKEGSSLSWRVFPSGR